MNESVSRAIDYEGIGVCQEQADVYEEIGVQRRILDDLPQQPPQKNTNYERIGVRVASPIASG